MSDLLTQMEREREAHRAQIELLQLRITGLSAAIDAYHGKATKVKAVRRVAAVPTVRIESPVPPAPIIPIEKKSAQKTRLVRLYPQAIKDKILAFADKDGGPAAIEKFGKQYGVKLSTIYGWRYADRKK